MKISIKSSQFSTTFSKDDWSLIQIFRTSRAFAEIRIVIAQWRRIWMSIHIWISVWFEQLQFNDFICLFNNRKFAQLFWKFQLASLFLFCLSSFYLKSQYDTSFSSKSLWLFSHHKSFALRSNYSITSIQLIRFILSIHRQKLLWTAS